MIDFTRAKNITLNGKDVRQLKIGDTIIWEKWVPESITLTSDKNVASQGDTVNLTATVLDKWGNGCPDEQVDFIILDNILVEEQSNITYVEGNNNLTSHDLFPDDKVTIKVSSVSGDPRFFQSGYDSGYSFSDLGIVSGSEITLIKKDAYSTVVVDGQSHELALWSANLSVYLDSSSSCSLDSIKHTRDELIDSGVTDSNGTCSVSYLLKDTNPLNIKAISSQIESNVLNLNIILWQPKLDGSDAITKWSSLTNKTENGVFTSHGSYLTEGWDNTGLWQLDADLSASNANYVGALICPVGTEPYTDSKLQIAKSWEGGSLWSPLTTVENTFTKRMCSNKGSFSNIHITVKKTASDTIEILSSHDPTGHLLIQDSRINDYPRLSLGSRDNPCDRNTGGYYMWSNILVKAL
ncbi:hypothetical protein [Methanobrevibacter sp. V14]|uniref:hypothetical protein n=1 Tax=Methanobrevibacter sp. V14 TaxID=3064280 RepID=UPI0027366222|nr:hypothetical protein [Methanobrevibacter sp. V14]